MMCHFGDGFKKYVMKCLYLFYKKDNFDQYLNTYVQVLFLSFVKITMRCKIISHLSLQQNNETVIIRNYALKCKNKKSLKKGECHNIQ